LEEAIFYYEKAVEADPTYIKAFYRKAEALKLMNNLNEALIALAVVVKNEPSKDIIDLFVIASQ